MNHFKGKQFQQDVIIVAVGYYLRYNLSYREVQEILYDRGINVSHTTIYRWVQEYGKLLYQIWKKKNKKSFYSWKMDETYIKIKGKWHYLYRSIDADGLTLDIWLRKKRDTQAAYAFLKRLVGMATVFLTNFIRCRTSFRMLFRLSLTMSLLGCDDLRQELTVKVRLPR
ncbi:transposase for insertion sequence-like element IS431mec [Enterococcus sp. AZ167]